MKNVLQIATADSLLELLAQHYKDLDCPNQFIPFMQKRIASMDVQQRRMPCCASLWFLLGLAIQSIEFLVVQYSRYGQYGFCESSLIDTCSMKKA
jgi:hypothetical protein